MRRSAGGLTIALTLGLALPGCGQAFLRVSPVKAHLRRVADGLRPDAPAGDPRLALALDALADGRRAETIGQRRKALIAYRDAALRASALLDDPASRAPPGDPRHAGIHQARDLHNRAVGRMLRLVQPRLPHPRRDWRAELARAGVAIAATTPELDPRRLDAIGPTDDHVLTGPIEPVIACGIGVPVVASRPRAGNPSGAEALQPRRIHRAATAVLTTAPDGTPTLVLHDPVIERCVRGQPLAHDLSAPLVAQLQWSGMPLYEYYGVINPEHLHEKAGIYLVDAYRPGRIPVLLIQGLWSSPNVWSPMISALRADPVLRDRFQFWVVLYPTAYPLPESAAMLRRSLAKARQALDPRGEDPALNQMVVVGKSTGGNLARMLAQDSGPDLWRTVFRRPIGSVAAPDELRARLAEQFFYRADPAIRRVVFVVTPHRGSKLANQATGRPSSLILRHGDPLRHDHDALVLANTCRVFQPAYQHRPLNTIDNLEEGSPLLAAIDGRPMAPWVVCHSIIGTRGRLGSRLTGRVSDGLVSQASAHLECAVSESTLPVGHFCEAEPAVIAEIGRILHEHLDEIR
jgi:hypothetical protein